MTNKELVKRGIALASSLILLSGTTVMATNGKLSNSYGSYSVNAESGVFTDADGAEAFPAGYYNQQKVSEIYQVTKVIYAEPKTVNVSVSGSINGYNHYSFTVYVDGQGVFSCSGAAPWAQNANNPISGSANVAIEP